MITCLLIIILDLVGINILDVNISNNFNLGTKLAGTALVFMLFIFSIITFITGVIQLIKNNDYKEIKGSITFIVIFFFIFILFKVLGVF